MLCIKCGKPATVGIFCDKHFLEREKLFDIQNLEIRTCDRCGAYFNPIECRWISVESMNDVVSGLIEKSIVTKNKIKKINVRLKPFGNKFTVMVRCTGLIRPCKKLKTEERRVLVIVKKIKCDNCVKLLGSYYEAVIQIRGPSKDAIFKRIKNMIGERTVASFKEVGDGYDLYFIKKADGKRVANALRKHYDILSSFKFATEKKGKKLYRNYFSVR